MLLGCILQTHDIDRPSRQLRRQAHVLAGTANGLRQVILPKRNEKDLEDIPKAVRTEMTFHPVARVGEVLDLALEPS